MASLVSEKRFLEFEGLKALILKLGALREEYLGLIEDATTDIAEIVARLDALLKKDTDLNGRVGIAAGKEIVVAIVEYIEAIRAELGTLPEPAPGKDIYTRLAEIEADCKQLNTRVATLENEAFTSVTAEYDRENNKIRIGFGTTNAAATAAEGGLVPNKSITIDTSDFVVDGLLGQVHSVVVITEGDSKGAFEYITNGQGETEQKLVYPFEEIPADKRINGHRYLVFGFKVNETDGQGEPTAQKEQNIWVDLVDLHDNFEFAAAPDSDQYVKLAVQKSHTKGATQVTYTVSLGDQAVADFSLVEGNTDDPSGGKIRGVAQLHTDLKAAEANIATLKDEVETETTGLLDRTQVLEDEVRNGWTDNSGDAPVEVPGLLQRAADLEKWTKENVITVKEISDYFDYWVMGDVKSPDDPQDPFKAAAAKRAESLAGVKKDFTVAPEL